MAADVGLPFIDPGQLPIEGLGPMPGDRYRNRNTGTICAVLALEHRRTDWVTVRIMGETQVLTLARFTAVFERI